MSRRLLLLRISLLYLWVIPFAEKLLASMARRFDGTPSNSLIYMALLSRKNKQPPEGGRSLMRPSSIGPETGGHIFYIDQLGFPDDFKGNIETN